MKPLDLFSSKILYIDIMLDLKQTKTELEKIGSKLVVDIQRSLRENDKVATGNLLNSIDYEVVDVQGNLILDVKYLKYLDKIEEGTLGGDPYVQFDDILAWVKVKNVLFEPLSYESTAFLITRKIENEGVAPVDILTDPISNAKRNLQVLSTSVAKDVRSKLKNITKNIK